MSYEITETIAHPAKFTCNVKFNGGEAQYYEVDSLDAAEIHDALEKVAADLAAKDAGEAVVAAAVDDLVIEGGKIKV